MCDPDEPVEIPIDGILDLHHFHPRDVRTLVPDYLDACQEEGILDVRLIHGKGTGKLRQEVRKALRKYSFVKSFEEGKSKEGGEGVTIAKIG